MQRFWDKVDRKSEAECWSWLGARNKQGYGSFKLNGMVMRAHRVAYELTKSEVPKGMCVLHRCDNPSCVNPDHLFLGTKKDNTQDSISKGRDKANRDALARRWAAMSKDERIAINEDRLKNAWAAGAVWWSERTAEERSAWARRAALARWSK